MTPSRTAIPILWSSSSLKPAASAMRMQILSARSTLSSSVSSVISIRCVWADILDSGEVLVEKTGVWVSQRWSTSQCSPGTVTGSFLYWIQFHVECHHFTREKVDELAPSSACLPLIKSFRFDVQFHVFVWRNQRRVTAAGTHSQTLAGK